MYDYKNIRPVIEINLRVLNIKDNEALGLVEKLRSILGSCVKQIYPVGAIRRKEKLILSLDMLVEVPDNRRQCLSEKIDYLLNIDFFISTLADTADHKQFLLRNNCLCNLYILSSSYQWGLKYFILTGPPSFVEKALSIYTKPQIHNDDLLERTAYHQVQDNKILTRLENEVEMFDLLGLEYLEPEQRI